MNFTHQETEYYRPEFLNIMDVIMKRSDIISIGKIKEKPEIWVDRDNKFTLNFVYPDMTSRDVAFVQLVKELC